MSRKIVFLIMGALALVGVSVLSVLATILIMNRQAAVNLADYHPDYAIEGVTIVDDPDALAWALDEVATQRTKVGMVYQYDLYSQNGRDFTCYIENPTRNVYDMVITIYADSELKDPIFTSKLLKAGSAFQSITLDRRLDPGEYDLTVGFTLVDVSDGTQKVMGSQPLGLKFHVSGEADE